jgi:hypothetical protein
MIKPHPARTFKSLRWVPRPRRQAASQSRPVRLYPRTKFLRQERIEVQNYAGRIVNFGSTVLILGSINIGRNRNAISGLFCRSALGGRKLPVTVESGTQIRRRLKPYGYLHRYDEDVRCPPLFSRKPPDRTRPISDPQVVLSVAQKLPFCFHSGPTTLVWAKSTMWQLRFRAAKIVPDYAED